MILFWLSSSCWGLAVVVLHVSLKRGAWIWPQLYSVQYRSQTAEIRSLMLHHQRLNERLKKTKLQDLANNLDTQSSGKVNIISLSLCAANSADTNTLFFGPSVYPMLFLVLNTSKPWYLLSLSLHPKARLNTHFFSFFFFKQCFYSMRFK